MWKTDKWNIRIAGLAIAAQLSRNHNITVVAKNLPGDDPTLEWASPWAGANFVAGYCTSPRDRKMQRDTFIELWRLAGRFPESSVKRIPIEDFFDEERTEDDLWFKDFVPGVRNPENVKAVIDTNLWPSSDYFQKMSCQKEQRADLPVRLS